MLNKLNPTIKASVLLIIGLVVAFCGSIYLDLGLIILLLVLIFSSKINYLSFLRFILIALLAAIGIYMTGQKFYVGDNNLVTIFNHQFSAKDAYAFELALRIITYSLVGISFSLTSQITDFVYSMHQQLKIPQKYSYGILAAFFMIPLVKQEYQKVKYAFNARGIKISIFNANYYLPILVKAIRWSEAIALAMQSKGFDDNATRSNYYQYPIRLVDSIFILIFVVYITVYFVIV